MRQLDLFSSFQPIAEVNDNIVSASNFTIERVNKLTQVDRFVLCRVWKSTSM